MEGFPRFPEIPFSGNPSPSLRISPRASESEPRPQNLGSVLDQIGTSFGPDLDQFWTRSGPVLVQIWTSFGPDLDQFWTRSGPVWDQIWTSLGPDLGQIGTRSGSKSDPTGDPKVTRNGTRNGPVSYLYGSWGISFTVKTTVIHRLFGHPATPVDPGGSKTGLKSDPKGDQKWIQKGSRSGPDLVQN